MSIVSLKQSGDTKRTFQRLEVIEATTRRAVRQAWFGLGKDLKSTANKEILRKPKGGRTYIVRGPSGRKRRHVASAAGETHANRSGALRNAIGWKVHGTDSMEFGYNIAIKRWIGASPRSSKLVTDPQTVQYAPFVELGTFSGRSGRSGAAFGGMAARPSLLNAINESDAVVQREFTEAMDRMFKP